jgi:hypothetical protein
MFKSFGSSLISLFIVLLSGALLLFIWTGSEAITFQRNGLDGDRTLADLAEARRKQSMAQEVKEEPMADEKKPAESSNVNTVLWLSVPGFRTDYVGKADTPFLDKIIGEGAATQKLKPIFPCLTFPSHAALATGAPVEKHGIPADVFRKDGETLKEPTDGSLLMAEPIWATATRQDRRVIVHDWPLSQNQSGDAAAAHFLTEYDPSLTDQQRLDKIMEVWTADKDEKKIRLVMARLNSINDAGHKFGPRAEETISAVTALDKALEGFIGKLQEKWKDLSNPGDNLAVIITTDHGMAELQKNINLPALMGEAMSKHADYLGNEAIAQVHFKDLPPDDAGKQKFYEAFDRELKLRIYWRSYTREELPPEWKYNAADRIGDRVLVLKSGFAFTEATADEPVFEPSAGPGFFGSWGYPVEDSSRMNGQAIIWGFPNAPPATGDLGEVLSTRLHPTVCKLLGIEPSKDATEEALPVN